MSKQTSLRLLAGSQVGFLCGPTLRRQQHKPTGKMHHTPSVRGQMDLTSILRRASLRRLTPVGLGTDR